MSARCSSCQASIFWAVSERGKRIPIDAAPVDDGNLYVGEGEGVIVAAALTSRHPVAVTARAAAESPRYRSHFATCPNADKHRQKVKP